MQLWIQRMNNEIKIFKESEAFFFSFIRVPLIYAAMCEVELFRSLCCVLFIHRGDVCFYGCQQMALKHFTTILIKKYDKMWKN